MLLLVTLLVVVVVVFVVVFCDAMCRLHGEQRKRSTDCLAWWNTVETVQEATTSLTFETVKAGSMLVIRTSDRPQPPRF